MRRMHRKQDRPFVFKLFDIFKHLRGSGTVDKIKKFRRDVPREFFSDRDRLDSRRPWSVKTPSEIPLGIPYYSTVIRSKKINS